MEGKKVTTRKKTLKRNPNYVRLYKEPVSTESIKVLFEVFSNYAPLSKVGYSFRNFYDIGAGIGQTIIGMTHMNTTLQSVGIELLPEKVQIGNGAIEKIRDASIRRRIELVCISEINESVHYNNACWISINTISDSTTLFEKLANEVVKGCIIVSSNSTENPAFKELNNITMPDNLRVYVYTKL